MKYNELGEDILKEIFNISVGQSADMLSEIVGRKIILDVPSVEIIDLENTNKEIDKAFNKIPEGTLMMSSINFEKRIQGKANLIFPANKMRKFINLCIDEENSEIVNDMNFTDMDLDIIREVGNIVLNAIVGGIGNFLDIILEYTIPEVTIFDKIDFKGDIKDKEDLCMIILYISFIIEDTEIEGAIIIDLTLNSLEELMKEIQRLEDDLNE